MGNQGLLNKLMSKVSLRVIIRALSLFNSVFGFHWYLRFASLSLYTGRNSPNVDCSRSD